MQASIQKEIGAGKKESAILQDFVLRYGVKVLSTPPASGFNLTVWILPALSLVAGLAILIVVTRRWRKPPAEPGTSVRIELDSKLRAAVEDELKASKL
jgi:cytochrome c-type biogenesis protein CcmH